VTTPSPLVSILRFSGLRVTFLALFVVTVLGTAPQAMIKRTLTYAVESVTVPLLCPRRPNWAAMAASLLWVQCLSSEILFLC
jgi:hypothetical protein